MLQNYSPSEKAQHDHNIHAQRLSTAVAHV